MLLFTFFLSLLSLAPTALSGPILLRRAITDNLLNLFVQYEQWAAASYCPWNNNSTNTKITCSDNSCPLVQDANTISVLEFENTNITDTTGFVATDNTNKQIVISFRGSEGEKNWQANTNFKLTEADVCQDCEVEAGFWAAWLDIRDILIDAINVAVKANPDYTIVATGHSLGGAVATLAALTLRNNGLGAVLVTYGSPRVGNRALAVYITNQNKGSNYRITHNKDLIPRLPPESFGFMHHSPEYWITSENDVTVGTNDIEICNGIGNSDCNSQFLFANAEDHAWYFAKISACYGDTVEV